MKSLPEGTCYLLSSPVFFPGALELLQSFSSTDVLSRIFAKLDRQLLDRVLTG